MDPGLRPNDRIRDHHNPRLDLDWPPPTYSHFILLKTVNGRMKSINTSILAGKAMLGTLPEGKSMGMLLILSNPFHAPGLVFEVGRTLRNLTS